jgi:hypothetical protein
MGPFTDEEFAKHLAQTQGVAAPAPQAAPPPSDAPLSDEDFAMTVPEDRSGAMMLNGLTFGLRPRIQAAIESGSVSGPDYERVKKEQWEKDDAYREANPGKAFAYEMVGGIPTMFVPGLGAGRIARSAAMLDTARTATQGSRVARAFGVGNSVGSVGHEAGVLGAKTMGLSGALGSREDDAGGRLSEGLTLAPMGYLGGRALDKLGRGAVGAAEHVRDAVRVGGNAQLGANMGLRRGLERDGISVDDLRNAVLPNTGRAAIPPGGAERILETYSDAIRNGMNPAQARATARQAYAGHVQQSGGTLANSTLDAHVGRVVQAFERNQNDIPLAIDEVAKLAGSRGTNLGWTRRAAQASPGRGREEVLDAVQGRQEDIIPAVRGRVNDTLGDSDFHGAVSTLRQRNRGNEDQLYGIARAHEQPFALDNVLDEANATHAFRGGPARKFMEDAMQIMRGDPLPNGGYQRHTLDSYIQSRGQLSDLIDDAMKVNPATGIGEHTSASRALVDLKSKMDDVVALANPRWKWANDIARGGRSVQTTLADARKMKLGGNDAHTANMLRNVEKWNAKAAELSRIKPSARTSEQAAELNVVNDQIEAARMGFGRAVHDALDGLGDTHDVAKLFLKGGKNSDSGVRRTVQIMMGKDADRFMAMMERAKIATGTHRQLSGSQTTPLREAIDEDKNQAKIAGLVRALGIFTNPKAVLGHVAEGISNRLHEARNSELLRRYATTTDDTGGFLRMLRELEQGTARGRVFANERGTNAYAIPGQAAGAFGVASPGAQRRKRGN